MHAICALNNSPVIAGPDDAKAEIRAAVEYLLRSATGGDRGDIGR